MTGETYHLGGNDLSRDSPGLLVDGSRIRWKISGGETLKLHAKSLMRLEGLHDVQGLFMLVENKGRYADTTTRPHA